MLGELYVDGKLECYVLEDEPREVKVHGETAIPAGTYQILPRAAGEMHPKYAARYPFHVGMAHLQNVPGFKYIYIHTGNTDDHTDGCLLVGDGFQKLLDGNFKIYGSRKAYSRLYPKIAAAWKRDEKVRITVKNP